MCVHADPPDDDLVRAVRAGDLAAFNGLVERYQQTVYAVVLRLVRDRYLAEDIVQDAFLRAYTALDDFRGGSFRAWLLRIAHNRALDVLRSRQRRPEAPLEPSGDDQSPSRATDSSQPSPFDHAARADLRRRLDAALAQLPDDQRVTVVLSDIEGFSYEEIAAITGVSLGTVKSRLSRGRARLRSLLLADEASRELLEGVLRHVHDGDDAAASTS